MGKVIFETQNRVVALTVQSELDRIHKWAGETKPAPRIRFTLTPKVELSPGRYVLEREKTLTHYMAPDVARLFFHDLAERYLFDEKYRVVFPHDKGRQLPGSGKWVADRLTATYRRYDQTGDERIIIEIWDGPGRYDRHLDYVYPLDKGQHVLAIMLKLQIARAMGLAGLEAIQVWNTAAAIQELGAIEKVKQLSLFG